METMIPPKVGMRLRTKNKKREKRGHKKREGPEKQKNKKVREKERRGNATILLPHFCFRVAQCSSYRESLELSLSYTSGIFHYRIWLVYSNDGLPQNALGLREQASWMHTHLVSF